MKLKPLLILCTQFFLFSLDIMYIKPSTNLLAYKLCFNLHRWYMALRKMVGSNLEYNANFQIEYSISMGQLMGLKRLCQPDFTAAQYQLVE